MKRPIGVTVIAVLNIASVFLLLSYALPPAQRPEVASLGFPLVIIMVLVSGSRVAQAVEMGAQPDHSLLLASFGQCCQRHDRSRPCRTAIKCCW